MCTMIAEGGNITGSGKGTPGWIKVDRVNVSYDHPTHMTTEHALNIDFVNEAAGPSARVAVELTPESARELAHKILATLDQAEAEGWLHEHGEARR